MGKSMSLKMIVISFALMTMSGITMADQHRNYDSSMLDAGKQLFQAHCAVCHGVLAEGTVENWHLRDENGKFPPPPLNGTAHTWHHSVGSLFNTIKNGTISIGGNMPSWKDRLSDDEVFSVIIWLSSLWPEAIYQAWMERNNS